MLPLPRPIREFVLEIRREAAEPSERVRSMWHFTALLLDAMLTWKFVAILAAMMALAYWSGYDVRR